MSASNQSGFTLIEILIAITLLAFVSLGVVNITENAALTMERTTEVNQNNLQIETALGRFEWDFSQIYSPLYFSTVLNPNQSVSPRNPNDPNDENPDQLTQQANFSPALQQYYEQLVARFERNEHFSAVSKEGFPIPRFYAPEKNVFEFFTSSNRRKFENTKQSHFAWVRYALANQEALPDGEENPDIPQNLKSLVRYFSADDPYNDKRLDPEGSDLKGSVLLRNVESLEFQYWNYNTKKWETSLKSIPAGENLIRGVKVLITWYDSQGHKRTANRTFRSHWPMVAPQDPAQTTPIGGTPRDPTRNQDDEQPGDFDDET